MNRGTEMTVVRVAPTRDGNANPSGRMADKHSRSFCGRTLDEWWAIQSWASRYITHSVLVGETPEHMLLVNNRLFDLEQECHGLRERMMVLARPPTMNHPTQDSGSYPAGFGYQWAKNRFGNINIVLMEFVVSPLKLPGDLDRMIESFVAKLTEKTPDGVDGPENMMSAAHTEYPHYIGRGDRMIYDSRVEGNLRYGDNLISCGSFNCMTGRYYEAAQIATAYRFPAWDSGPWRFDVEPWQEIHIDYEYEWEQAEFWFNKRIGGLEAYERYRRTWSDSSTYTGRP